MELINATGMEAGYTLGVEPSGRERLVVAVKGTFEIPRGGGTATPAEDQTPLVEADQYHGEPGHSSPRCETDYAPVKPRCDVLLNCSAHAPGGRPAERVQVGVKLGDWFKTFMVVGDRIWRPAGATFGPSAPARFTVMPITYDRAYGGHDDLDPDPARHDAFLQNPIGRGYHQVRTGALIDGRPCPNTEAVDDPVRVPWGGYRPMGFGVIGRGWQPRIQYAGTYDQHWQDHVFPFLPADFDERYYQAAPEDQQTDHLRGGEEVILVNLTPEGRTRFRLPAVGVPVVFLRKRGGREEMDAVLDTVTMEPDRWRLTLTWRASLPLKRNLFEIVQVVAGRMSRAWWRAREFGKTYHPSIDALIRAQQAEAEEEEPA